MASPNLPEDFIDRVLRLERQVRELSGRLNIRPALNTISGGAVTIRDGGSLIVEDSQGHAALWVGRMNPDVDGLPQYGTQIRRMDGSIAFAVWTSATSGAQPVRIYDKSGSQIFADDLVGGGLAVPWLACPLPVPFAQSTWGTTTSATWASVSRSVGFIHHPKVYLSAAFAVTSGTATGQLRITFNGTVVATGAAGAGIDGVYDVPSFVWGGSPQQTTIELQLIRLTGTGTVGGQVRSIYGRQS